MGSKVSKHITLPRPAPPGSTLDYTPRESLSLYSKTNPGYIKSKKFKWKPKRKLTDNSEVSKQENHLETIDNTRDDVELSTVISDDTVTEISDIETDTRNHLIPSSLSTSTVKGRTKPKSHFSGFIQNEEKESFVRQLEIERQVKQQELHQRQVLNHKCFFIVHVKDI